MPIPSRRRGRPTARRRLVPAPAVVAVVFVLATLGLLAVPAAAPDSVPGARALGPLPACRYDDILTSPRRYADWSITLVDTILRVPRTYVPPDLVPVSEAGVPGSGSVRALLVDDLREMAEAARAADAAIGIQSAYRSYEQQQEVFASWVAQLGRERALRVSARPGHSEHQLGLAIDVRSHPGGSPFEGDWGQTKAGMWMAANAWKYGFVMSYPRKSRAVTCYDYEPWHFRYLGRELAAEVHASGLTIREYLWANFTTTIVPPPSGQPVPSFVATPPSSTASPEPSLTPEPSELPSPSPGPTDPASPDPGPSSTAGELPSPAPTASPPPDGGPISGLDGGALAALALLAAGLVAALAAAYVASGRGRSGAVL